MDINEIKRLVKLVESSSIDEIEIQEEGLQIRITKSKGGVSAATPQVIHTTPHPIPQVHKEAIAQEIPKSDSGAQANPSRLIEIRSPMVGTFYRAPAPDSQPYVREGDEIKPGKTLCIIEAMKLMNEIEAEISGSIAKILVENAKPVEYNQPLFLVEPK
ncbi:MAG TPA: acetyl-CoA carboxylase biotin carboxyl carrier protein [bacterium]